MDFEQRKRLSLASWTAVVLTAGLILTIDKPSLWVFVAGLTLIPTAVASWLWHPAPVTIAQLIDRGRR